MRPDTEVDVALLANAMFDLPLVEISSTDRISTGHGIGEIVATAGLVALIFPLARTGRHVLSAVLQQLQPGAASREALGGDPGSDDDCGEQAGADRLGEQPPRQGDRRGVDGVVRPRRPGHPPRSVTDPPHPPSPASQPATARSWPHRAAETRRVGPGTADADPRVAVGSRVARP